MVEIPEIATVRNTRVDDHVRNEEQCRQMTELTSGLSHGRQGGRQTGETWQTKGQEIPTNVKTVVVTNKLIAH